MSIRKSGKILAIVGFVLSVSCIGILYSNLTSVTEERSQILTEKNSEIESFKHRLNEKDIELQNMKSFVENYKSQVQEEESKRTQLAQKVAEVEHDNNLKDNKLSELENKVKSLEVSNNGLHEEVSSCKSSSESLQSNLKQSNDNLQVVKDNLATCRADLQRQIDTLNKFDRLRKVEDEKGNEENDVDPVNVKAEKEIKLIDTNLQPPKQENNPVIIEDNQNIPNAQNPAPVEPHKQVVDNNPPNQAIAPPPAAPEAGAAPNLHAPNEEENDNAPQFQPPLQPVQPPMIPQEETNNQQANNLNEQQQHLLADLNDSL